MMTAVLAGLMTAGVAGCQTKTRIEYRTADAGPEKDAGHVGTDKDSGTSPVQDAGPSDAGADAGGPVVTKTVKGERTFASLEAECAKLGGMIQLTASCAGSNKCKGFSYGDWGPGEAVLTEHTCAHMNGCNGLSCVVMPADQGRTGKEIYGMDLPAGGPSSCTNCHAVWNSDFTKADLTKFRLWVLPHSGRNASNWLDLSVTAQEGILAFGKTNMLPDGTPIDTMEGYHQLLSRAEIKRVVAYIRTLTPEVHLLLEHRDDTATDSDAGM
jgi:mono/diheme cytochrome c family protein